MKYQVVKVNNKRDKIIHKRKTNHNQKHMGYSLCGKILDGVNHTGTWQDVNCKACLYMMSYSAKYYIDKRNIKDSEVKTEKDIDIDKLKNYFANKIRLTIEAPIINPPTAHS